MTEADALHDFSGNARLLPLPDSVLFPAVVQPLHIFESRYLEMVEDAFAGDRLIAMALLKPGWQSEYYSRPPVEETVCIGHVINHERLENGRYNILLRGAARARIVRELPPLRSFRQVELRLVTEHPTGCTDAEVNSWSRQLMAATQHFFVNHPQVIGALKEIVQLDVDLGHLVDLLAHLLPLGTPVKQFLLGEPRVLERVRLLLKTLEVRLPHAPRLPISKYPPDFGAN